jgi:signal transduction histidine kinase
LEVLGNHSYLLDQKGITVQNYIRPRTCINMSHFHAMTVMENLVSNAILYNTENGTITLTCEREGNMQVLRVEDTGIGLTKDQLNRVFDDFYKADESRHDHSAHGLGLAIVRRIVALYGGSVFVKSPGPGCGSTFQVLIRDAKNQNNPTIVQGG